MPYVVMLHEGGPVSQNAMESAFASVDGLVALDGSKAARRGHGVIANDMTKQRAKSLQRALSAQGIGSEVVSDDWLGLPRATSCRRLDITAEALMAKDVLGVATNISWAKIRAIVAAVVPQHRQRRDDDEEWTDSYVLERSDVLQVQLVSDDPARRLLIESNRFDHRPLGNEATMSDHQNLARVVRDIVAHAPSTVALGRGASLLIADPKRCERYRNAVQLEWELAWTLWRHHGPGRAIEGSLDFRRKPFGSEGPTADQKFQDNVRAATLDRVTQSYESDLETYMRKTRLLDVAFAVGAAGVAGAIASWRLTWELEIEGPVARFGIAGLCAIIVGPIAFYRLRNWRKSRYWTG